MPVSVGQRELRVAQPCGYLPGPSPTAEPAAPGPSLRTADLAERGRRGLTEVRLFWGPKLGNREGVDCEGKPGAEVSPEAQFEGLEPNGSEAGPMLKGPQFQKLPLLSRGPSTTRSHPLNPQDLITEIL